MAERGNERLARHVVAESLGLPVTRYEDGTADSQVDAVIHLADGDLAALEVVADHEASFNAQWDALEKLNHRISVPGLTQAWSAKLARRAKIKTVAKRLPALMLKLQDEVAAGTSASATSLAEDLDRLHVHMVYPLTGSDQSGYVNLHAEGWSGWASGDINHYVEEFLASAEDVPAKLAAHPTAQKHAFIWATIGTNYAVQSQLERRDQPLPTGQPNLPHGVTHIWIAGSFTSQGVLAWFPDCGWWRPAFEWPESGTLVLDGEMGDNDSDS